MDSTLHVTKKFPGRLALQQRVLPYYRAPFFNALASSCEEGMSVFAGDPLPEESISTTKELDEAEYVHAENKHLLENSYYLCYQENLIDWVKDTDPDALILEANPRYLETLFAIRWMHARGRPVIGWGLGAPLHKGFSGWVRKKYWGFFLKRFDALISYSKLGAEHYALLGVSGEKIFVAPNAVMPKPKEGIPTRPIRRYYEPLVLIFVGRLQERKKIDNLLNACASLSKALQPKLWIVGEGPVRKNLENLAKEVYPEARFFGERQGDELKRIWKEADLFVLPGTGGLAVQEAMSYGLPVVVARGDGTQEDLVRSTNGWLVPPDDVSALKRTLEDALTNQHRLLSMGVASYKIVAEEVNIEKMVEIFMEALQRVMKSR